MVPSLFEALFALLVKEGPSVTEDQVHAVMGDPTRMTQEVLDMREALTLDEARVQAALAILEGPASA